MSRFHNQQFSNEHRGETAPVCAVLEYMDPNNIPFDALTEGPTNSGKTHYLMHQMQSPFFDYMVLIFPTFVHNKTYDGFVDRYWRIFARNYPQEEVEL